jgi:hypothetical protein
MGESGSK